MIEANPKIVSTNIDPDGYVELEIEVFGKLRCIDFHLDEVAYYRPWTDPAQPNNPNLAKHFAVGHEPLTGGPVDD